MHGAARQSILSSVIRKSSKNKGYTFRFFTESKGIDFDPQIYAFRIENPYIWKKLSLFSCIFIFPPYLCSDSATNSVSCFGNLYIYCKHFTKIIPNSKNLENF